MTRFGTPTRIRTAAAAMIALAAFVLATAAAAQNPHPVTPTDGPSSLPMGPGAIRGVVADAATPGATGGLTVALYALQPDGTPGIGSAQTAADGSFAFEQLAVDPAIVYLVGIRYAGIPYGERMQFAAGETAAKLEIPVSRPVADGSGVRVIETSVRVESLGTRLAVEESHRLANDGSAPVLVPATGRADGSLAPFEALLPEGATHFQPGAFSDAEAFGRDGSRLRYWGPVYPGEQDVSFSYQLPIAADTRSLPLSLRFPRGTAKLRLLRSPHGPRIEGDGLRAGTPGEGEDGFLVLESGALPAGGALSLSLTVPKSVERPDALTIRRAELAIEIDDTVLEVTQSQQIEVAQGSHVAGRPGAPLLRFELPQRAELVGLSTDAGRLGATPVPHGVEVLGPLAPGTHELAFRYRLPTDPGDTELDLRFPRTVATLVVRAADTGLVIHSERLHRLRPEPIGTRTWMFREAFHVEPDEVVSLRFEPLDAGGPSKLGALFFVVSAAALVLLFVVSPLRATRSIRTQEEEERQGPAHERDLVYATIRDLEHDFETGKVAQADYDRSRTELWAQAKELMQHERQASPVPEVIEREPQTSPATKPARVSVSLSVESATGGFCPSCSQPVDPGWQFCSHCGGGLGEPTG